MLERNVMHARTEITARILNPVFGIRRKFWFATKSLPVEGDDYPVDLKIPYRDIFKDHT